VQANDDDDHDRGGEATTAVTTPWRPPVANHGMPSRDRTLHAPFLHRVSVPPSGPRNDRVTAAALPAREARRWVRLGMTTVLIALDESPNAVAVASAALRVFGPDASYLAINVAETTPRWTSRPLLWGGVYGYPYYNPYAGDPYLDVDPEPARGVESALAGAERAADETAAQAGVPAEPLGDIGDAADAIISAARDHRADVIVLGASDKKWWQRVLDGSVSRQVMNEARRPVLVVPHPEPE
jgi:nucleotide-binding universal stress UspA family protein